MKSNIKYLFVSLFAGAALCVGVAGCSEKTESEKAADAMKDAANQAGKAAEKVGEAAKEAGKAVEKAAEKAVEKK